MAKSVTFTTYFSQKPHPNDPNDDAVVGRTNDGRVLQNEIRYIAPWYNSILKLGIEGRVFYDNLDPEFVKQYQTDEIKFIKVDTPTYSNNDGRFFVYREWLEDNDKDVDSVFLTDGSDVTVVHDPAESITDPIFDGAEFLVCEDSIKLAQFPYLDLHQQMGWPGYMKIALQATNIPLINMGVIGASRNNILDFLDKFCETRVSMGNPAFNADMWVGQYVFRCLLNDRKIHIGENFTSKFKRYEIERNDVYFIHK